MTYAFGILICLAAAQFQAAFALPMKYIKKWNWEISWLGYCLIGLIPLPWLAAYIKVPNLLAIYAGCTAHELAVPILFGALWGVAVAFYGVGISYLGISLGNSIMSALGPTVGSLIPLVLLHREKVFARQGLSIFAGIFLIFFGVYFCGVAGQVRDMEKVGLGKISAPRRYGAGLLYTILAGVLAPSVTLALAFGTPIMKRATDMGVSAANSTFLIWVLVFPAGSVVCSLYCLYVMKKSKSWSQLRSPESPRYLFLVVLMSVIWLGAILLYGVSTVFLGPLGVPIAQALYVIFSILGGYAVGFLIGEWKGVERKTLWQLGKGVAFLVIACLVIAIGNQ